MDSMKGQGGIQMLLTAEQRPDRLFPALKTTSGSSGSNVKRLDEETAMRIQSLKESASRVSSDVVAMLIKHVTAVEA
ncbi:V-type proton ATPase subunit G3 [Vitis vinifera]|uniref:V-type proton ATPase subunit G3 n=1 Tax=Vitis vinifera TaxID=29760 RepID=A0A438CIZ7_VITVI|nr:V-type proton ATPase subunit G3 [Vitis vinifera]